MTGADIIGALLTANGPLIEVVPADRIKEDRLPDQAELPALLVRTVSSLDRQPLKRGAMVRENDRIAVTVRANSVRERKAVLALVRACCAGVVGDVGGGKAVAITTAGRGPTVNGPGNSFEQTQDFRVSHDAPA